MKANVTVVKPSQTPQYSVDDNTLVNIDLSGGGTTKDNRIAVHELKTFKELGINPTQLNVSEPPTFPKDEIRAVSENSSLTPEQAADKVTQLVNNYKSANAEYSASNKGMEIEDLINVAVIDILVRDFGFSRTDEKSKAYIAPKELLVNSFVHNGGIVFKVTGTAIWG